MNRSLVALVLAPLALVLACGGDDGSGDSGLFQSFGGEGGKKANDLFDLPDDEESPLVDGDAGGKSGGAAKGGSAGKGGSTAKGGSAGAGGSSSSGKGGNDAAGKGGAGGAGSSAGKGGTGGSGGSSSKGGASGAGGSASKGGTGGASGSSSKGGSGGTSGKGGTGGNVSTPDPYAGAIVPSTCEETHGSVGCCGPDNRAYYLDDDGSIAITTCTNGKVCGWRADTQWYSCVDAANEDPSGVYPLTCGGTPVVGACDGGTGGTSGTGGTGGTSSGPTPGSEWSKCTYAWDCLSGLVCSAGYCQKPTGTGAGSNSGSSCQAKGGYGGLGCTGQFVLGCQQIGCGCCESGGVGQCCLLDSRSRSCFRERARGVQPSDPMPGPRPKLRPHRSLRALAVVPAALITACGSPAPVVPPPGPMPTAAMPEPTVAPPPVAEIPAKAAAQASAFRKVGAVDEATVFARGPGSVYLAVGIDIVAIAEGDAVTLRPELQQATDFPYRSMSQLVTVARGAGDEVWASWIFPEGRVGATTVERFDGKKWRKATRSRNGYAINQLFPLSPTRIVAIEEAQMFPDDSPKILAAFGPKAGLPQVSKRVVKNTTGAPSAVNLAFLPMAVLASKGGGTQLVGNPFPVTEDEITRPQYEVFDEKGKSKGHGELDVGVANKAVGVTVSGTLVPGGPILLTVSEGSGSSEKSSLRLLRGGAEKPEIIPVQGVTGTPAGAAADEKGDVYLLTSGASTTLFRIGADGNAQPIALPSELSGASTTPMTVMAKNADDVWLFAPNAGKLDVYRTKANATAIAVELPNPQDAYYEKLAKAAAAREELVLAKAYSKKCATPFVLLYTLAKTAPADYDFPATRDALKGHTELSAATFLEFSRGGKRFFGAAVPSGDLGQKLVDAVKGKVAGSTPQLVCDAPTAERTLRIDLSTGKIKP